MSALQSKKENVIMLPNKDKLPTGKIKEISKIMNMVSAEYGIEDDLTYFKVEKEKSMNVFKLQIVPHGVLDIHSINAKKFVVYDLVKNGHDCIIKTDDDLNKRAQVINDLLDKIDDRCKETINSKLNAMFDIPGELDGLLDQLLTDPQFNSFKYKVLDQSKTNNLLCINSDGICVRSTESPFDVTKQLCWQDIFSVKSKSNKLIFRKKNGENEDIVCCNKKVANTASDHVSRYLIFIGNRESGDSKRVKGGWLRGLSNRIRQSFNKRSRSHDAATDTSLHPPVSKSMNAHYLERDPPNSTVPESSVISDDCLDHIGSTMEPSIKTNSTHDVSVGSANSFRNFPSSLDQNQASFVRQSGQDDHMSVKTNSTYEVSFESNQSPRTLSNVSKSDFNPAGQALSSFGLTTQAKKNPHLSQIKGNVMFSKETDGIEDVIPSVVVEVVKHGTKGHDTKIVAVPPPMVPIRSCETQPSIQPVVIKQGPPAPPVRRTELEVHISPESYVPPLTVSALTSVPEMVLESQSPTMNKNNEIINTSDIMMPTMMDEEVIIKSEEINVHDLQEMTAELEQGFEPTIVCNSDIATSDLPKITPCVTQETQLHQPTVIEYSAPHSVIASDILTTTSENDHYNYAVEDENESQRENTKFPTIEEVVEKDEVKSVKVECKLPVYQRKSIPSPKIQRPSRIPSVSSQNDPPSSNDSSTLKMKLPSPSDKENYNSAIVKNNDSSRKYSGSENSQTNQSVNFSRFEKEECTVDSKTTFTTVSSVGDSVTKKSTKTEITSVKSSGIPAPKQYKATTTITSTVKKPLDAPKSPVLGAPRTSGIPRMSTK